MLKHVFKNVCIVEDDFGDIFAANDVSSGDNSSCSSTCEGDEGKHSSSNGERLGVKCYTLSNANRMEVKLLNWGATIQSIKYPDKYGDPADLVLGFDDLKGYLDPTLNPFLGCALGRCANRIRDGVFRLDGQLHQLTRNEAGRHHLHGGTNGFGRRLWESRVDQNGAVVMSLLSPDGEEGYPGAVLASIEFRLGRDDRLEIGMRASCSKPTPLNMSHGSFFNLAGHDAGEAELRKHELSLNSDRWTVADFDDPIPIGTLRRAGGTIMDLRSPKLLGDLIDQVPGGKGFDHNFCVFRSTRPGVSFVGRAFHEKSGRFLEVYSDQPGVQLYTCGRLPPWPLSSSAGDSESCPENCDCSSVAALEFLPGKSAARYTKFCAFSLQPQIYPDAVNVPHFPCAILRPGQVYRHDLVYKFGVQLGTESCGKRV